MVEDFLKSSRHGPWTFSNLYIKKNVVWFSQDLVYYILLSSSRIRKTDVNLTGCFITYTEVHSTCDRHNSCLFDYNHYNYLIIIV